MPLSRSVWIGSTLLVVLLAIASAVEGTFTSKNVTMGFLNHGGMWGDLLILPLVNAAIVPHLPPITAKRAAIAAGLFLLASVPSALVHAEWAAIGRALGGWVARHRIPAGRRGAALVHPV